MAILTRGLLNSTALTNVGLVATGLALASGSAMALPQNGQVVGGTSAIVNTSPTQLTINQTSQNAVINWQSFSIGKNETTTFNEPNSSSVAFNRVTGVSASVIQGSLKANGQVVLVNPNGLVVTNTANVNVGGLVASTAGITNANAMAGNMVFDQAGSATAKISNAGSITAAEGGLVALVAPTVLNSGVITAKLGKVALAAGDKWAMDLYGDKLVQFAVDDQTTGGITQSGVINANTAANGGYAVQLTVNDAKSVVRNVINMSGVINASSITTDGGDILLEGGTAGTNVSGKINSNGGKVVVSGADIVVKGAIDATGTAGGGLVDIGTGDGVLAKNVAVEAGSSITSNGGVNGNGGNVSIKSSGSTVYAGSITSQGGTKGGHGGNVTTDGNTLNVDGATVDTSAPAGNAGDWNIVETNVNVTAGMANSIDKALAKGNVDVASGEGQANNITVSSAVNWNSDNTLTLESYKDIDVKAAIKNAGQGNIVLRADDEGTDVGSVTFSGKGTAQTNGQVGIYYDPINGYTQPVTYSAAQAHGAKGTTAYMLVNNFADLEKVNNNLGGTYALGKTINANIAINGQLTPIGSPTDAFTGLFDGFGGIATYTIDNPWFHGDTEYGVIDIGVFGNNAGTIRNVTVKNADFAGLDNTGGLVGYNSGRLINDAALNSTIHGYDILGSTSNSTGGLVGFNSQTGYIRNGRASGYVYIDPNSDFAGGFVGTNEGTILDSSFVGTVNAGCNEVGGFVGGNYGLISGSSAAAKVFNGGGGQIGGFAGLNGSTTVGGISIISEVAGLKSLAVAGTTLTGRLLNNSAAAGDVYSADNNTQVGGFVGVNEGGALISGGTASGNVYIGNNTNEAGGFAGANLAGSTIENSKSSATMTIGNNDTDVGGFVGHNEGTIKADMVSAADPSFGSNNTNVGGFAGYNSGSINGAVSHAPLYGATGNTNVGGLIGYNIGRVSNSRATGDIYLGDNSTNVGGLIGYNTGVLVHDTIAGSGVQLTAGTVGCDCGPTGYLPPSSNGSAIYVGQHSMNVGGYVGQEASGTINGVTVANSVRAGLGSQNVGGLVGNNNGNLTNDHVRANVYSAEYSGSVGGMVGLNTGLITGSYISGLVSVGGSSDFAGGVIGANYGDVTDTHFTDGTMAAGCEQIGGFVGGNFGTVSDSTFHGTVQNGGGLQTGGFAGQNTGLLATDSVNNSVVELCNTDQGGGFVGYNGQTGVVTNGKATVSLYNNSGVTDQGGFVGKNDGKITGSHVEATVSVGSAVNDVGGFAGTNSGLISGGSVTGTVIAGDSSVGLGGFAGGNFGRILASHSNTDVHAGNSETYVGGFAGVNTQLISGSTETGQVFVGNNAKDVGVFTGYNTGTGTITEGYSNSNGTIGNNAVNVGGFIGENDGLVNEKGNNGFSGRLVVGSSAMAVGGLVGYNIGRVNGGYASGPMIVGNNASYVGGDIGWNDAGGTVTGVSHDGRITVGNNATGVGGVAGLNGSDPTNGRGDFAAAAASISKSSSQGRITVGTDSFAIGGIVGWDSAWTANNSMSGTVYFGEVSDGHDTMLKGNNVTSQGVVYGGDGTTYIHNANQVGCDERAGGNCFGIAGQETITINAKPDANSAGDTLFTLTGMAPGDANPIVLGNVLESHDHQGNVIIGKYTVMADPNNPGFYIVSVGPDFGLNPNNRNANLDYKVKYNFTKSVPPVVVTPPAVTPPAITPPTPAGVIMPIAVTSAGTLTPIAAASQGNLVPLTANVLGSLNQAAQIDCLKVNLEVRGVQSDSPIDCSQPLQVNGF